MALPPQDAPPHDQRRPKKCQRPDSKIRRTARVGHLLTYDRFRLNAFGLVYGTWGHLLGGVLILSRRCVFCILAGRVPSSGVPLASIAGRQLLARFVVVIRIEPVGIARVLLELRLSLFLRCEVSAVEVSFATPSASSTGKVLTRDTIVVCVEVAGIARVAVQFRLGRILRAEAGAIEHVFLCLCCSCQDQRIENPTYGSEKQRARSLHSSSPDSSRRHTSVREH